MPRNFGIQKRSSASRLDDADIITAWLVILMVATIVIGAFALR